MANLVRMVVIPALDFVIPKIEGVCSGAGREKTSSAPLNDGLDPPTPQNFENGGHDEAVLCQ
jgi:hypothetical protein